MAQALEDSLPNFTGSWTLRTSENLDAFLKDEGWGYIMRKAAAAVSAYQTIVQTDSEIKIELKNKKGKYSYTAPLDGTEITYIDNDKDKVVSKTVKGADGKSLEETIFKGKNDETFDDVKKQKVMLRYMKGGEMCLKITNTNNVHTVRIFSKDKK